MVISQQGSAHPNKFSILNKRLIKRFDCHILKKQFFFSIFRFVYKHCHVSQGGRHY